jgi:hypothetical protein
VFRFDCPSCRKTLQAPGQWAGRKTACPGCGQRLLIPTPAPGPHQSQLGPRLLAVLLTVLGGLCGLLVSYLLRPQFLGQGPSLVEWFTGDGPRAGPQRVATICVCGLLGSLLGLAVGAVLLLRDTGDEP